MCDYSHNFLMSIQVPLFVLQVVQALRRKGIDVNKQFKSGETALTYSSMHGLTQMVQALIQGQ